MFDDDPRVASVDLPSEVDIAGALLDRCADHFDSFRVVWEQHLPPGMAATSSTPYPPPPRRHRVAAAHPKAAML